MQILNTKLFDYKFSLYKTLNGQIFELGHNNNVVIRRFIRQHKHNITNM